MSRGSVVTPSRPTCCAKGLPLFRLSCPPATVIQPKRSSFSIEVPKMRVWLDDQVSRLRRQRAAEARHERFLERARAERLDLLGVERAEARQQAVGVAQLMIQPQAELIEVAVLFLDGGQVLQTAAPTSAAARAAGAPSRSDRSGRRESGCPANGVQTPVVGIVSGSQIGAKPAKLPARSAIDGTENARVSERPIRSRFEAGEEERPVAHDRAAERPAELVLPERRNGLPDRPEVVRRIEGVVAQELEQRCRGTRSRRRAWRR